MPDVRPLSTIAYDIRQHWPWSNINDVARAYLEALGTLDKITDKSSRYGDSADSTVRFFLSNASSWQGADARRIKAELRGMLPE